MRSKRIRVRHRSARSLRMAVALLFVALGLYVASLWLQTGRQTESPPPQNAEMVASERTFPVLGGYFVQLHRARDASTARIEAARHMRRGAAGYVMQDGESYLVIGALYDAKEEAEAVVSRLIEREGIAAEVVARQFGGVKLRVTATQAQIDAFFLGEESLRPLTSRLAELAQQLDQGKIGIEPAARQIGLIHEESALRLHALRDALGGDEHPLMRRLCALYELMEQATGDAALNAAQSPLSFSAKIKYNSISMRLQHLGFLHELAA